MSELSPAAQAVLDAATERWLDVDDDIPAQVAAAALRAVADQVLCRPEIPKNEYNLLMRLLDKEVRAIATELENHQ